MIRRRWVGWCLRGVPLALLGLVLWAFWLEPASLTVRQQRIVVPLQRHADLRVAVLSDLHVGSPFNGIDNLRRVVALTNEQHPDIVCILGDLVIQGVQGGHFVSPEDIAAELAGLRSTHGSFAVLGNHDVWLDYLRVEKALRAKDINVIEDTAVRLDTGAGPLWLVGIGDFMTGRARVDSGLSHVADDAPVMALTHNPDVFAYVPKRVSLTLAGHTHGGQVQLPFGWRPIVPSIFGQRYAAGYVIEDGRQLYVSTGVGTSIIPVRFRVAPSIDLLTLGPG